MKAPNIHMRSNKSSPSLFFLGWIIFSVILIAWIMYQLGYRMADTDVESLQAASTKLLTQVDVLKKENASLKADNALAKRTQQVEHEAGEQVKEELRSAQQEMFELQEEIAFYRGIVTPSEVKAGIRIQRFELIPLAEVGLYHYRLVLTQVLKSNVVSRGTVSLTLSGIEGGVPKQWSLVDVAPQKPIKPLKFRFKYFQKFEGDILLPNGFSPYTVEERVKPAKGSDIHQDFDWPGTRDANT